LGIITLVRKPARDEFTDADRRNNTTIINRIRCLVERVIAMGNVYKRIPA